MANSQLDRPFGFEVRGGNETIRRAAAKVFAENPRLRGMETIITAGTGPFPVEAFPATEPDNPFFGEGRPAIRFNTNRTTEMFSPEQMILGEHLHFLNRDDPEFRNLKSTFIKSFNEDQKSDLRFFYERARQKFGERRPFDVWLDVSLIDQAIGAGLFGKTEEFAPSLFGPKQREIIQKFREALRRPANRSAR